MHRQAEEKLRREMAQAENKKKMVLQTLKESMDEKQYREKYNKMMENQLENNKLRENEVLAQREEQYREDYLRKLKNRAMTIDYGSH